MKSKSNQDWLDMGDVNNELKNFKIKIENKEEDKSISKYVLTFMVREVFASHVYPFVYYAGQGFSRHHLYLCAWESVGVL